MIPKKIFQTYKVPYEALPENVLAMTQTWKDKNPDYEYHYYSDTDIEKFIVEHYGKEWHDRYLSLRFPVMKADLFRILAMYSFGGFYADLDTVCREPLDSKQNEDTELVLGVHVYFEFAHWFFGFKPKHPLLKKLIDSLAYNLDNFDYEDFNDPNFLVYQSHIDKSHMAFHDYQIWRYVCQITGPWWWSSEIASYFDVSATTSYHDIVEGLPVSGPLAQEDIYSAKNVWLGHENIDSSDAGLMKHVFGSDTNFYGQEYHSWFQKY